ncbi:MAG: 2-octaprenyl-6-methoxyphenyl hydroxylase [Pseudomonadota bacterium]
MQSKHYDIIIVGAGLLGSSLACALQQTGLKIAIIDAKSMISAKTPENRDIRSIALSLASCNILKNIGFTSIFTNSATPIKRIHVSDKGHFGFTRLNAADYDLTAFGYVIPYHLLVSEFMEKISAAKAIDTFAPATVQSIDLQTNSARCQIEYAEQKITLETNLLIAADGSHSFARKQLNLATQQQDHQQQALVANVGIISDTFDIAYERFCDSGIIALLPQKLHQYGLVWTDKNSHIESMLALNDDAFLQHLQSHFGYRLGRFTWIGKRFNYPLQTIFTQEQAKPHFLLLGNAAHTVHPVAAQGFNLGLRDLAELLATIELMSKDNAIGKIELLNDFITKRIQDQQRIVRFTHSLINTFKNPLASVKFTRNMALNLLDGLPSLKRSFAFRSMGFNPPVPEFAYCE